MTTIALHHRHDDGSWLRDAGLWLASGVVILVLHAVAVHTLQSLQAAEPMAASEPALMIDLAPLAVTTPDSVESQTIGEEPPVETLEPVEGLPETVTEQVEPAEPAALDLPAEPVQEAVPDVDPAPQQIEPEPVEPAEIPVDTALAQDVPAEAVEPAEPLPVEPDPVEPEAAQQPVEADVLGANPPEIIEQILPDVVAALPQVKPSEPEVVETPRRAEKKVQARRKPAPAAERKLEKPQRKTVEAVAKPVKRAARSEASVKSEASRAPTVSPARWHARVQAWIARRKPRRVQGVGQVLVSFAVNASGTVVSARVSRSSGNPTLDETALEMVRRASPVPAPPPELARARIQMSIPVQFRR